MFRIPLMRPSIGAAEHAAVREVLESGMLTEGSWTRRLEAAVEAYLGVRHVIAVTSCTTGLEIALRAMGIGPGDEVIVPNFTYPATASAVSVVGALPVLADVDPKTMLIDLGKAAELVTPRTRALIPVSLFGNPVDSGAVSAFCKARGIDWIEDAACSLGAEVAGVRVGAQARVSVFSLHPRKMITTGEGGLIATDDEELASWMRSYKHFGVAPSTQGPRPVFAMMGSNAKLSNLLAAIGVSQMERFDDLLAKRRALARRYEDLLSELPDIELPATTANALHSYQSFCVLVPERDRLFRELRDGGIEVQIGTYALNREPAFSGAGVGRGSESYPGTDRAFEACLTLPLFEGMKETEQREVVDALKLAMNADSRYRAGGAPCVAS